MADVEPSRGSASNGDVAKMSDGAVAVLGRGAPDPAAKFAEELAPRRSSSGAPPSTQSFGGQVCEEMSLQTSASGPQDQREIVQERGITPETPFGEQSVEHERGGARQGDAQPHGDE